MLNKEIHDKVEEIVLFIEQSPKYQKYLLLERKLKNHSRIPSIIEKIKEIQKETVRLEIEGKEYRKQEQKLKELESMLLEIPLYQDFIETQQELNAIFSMIKKSLDDLFQF